MECISNADRYRNSEQHEDLLPHDAEGIARRYRLGRSLPKAILKSESTGQVMMRELSIPNKEGKLLSDSLLAAPAQIFSWQL